MKILKDNKENNLIIGLSNDFQTDLGWQDNLESYVEEKLYEVVNPISNYETKRIIHKPYTTPQTIDLEHCVPNPRTETRNIKQCDIWYEFYFHNTFGNYVQEYSPIGLTLIENSKHLKEVDNSFFKIEFFKTPNNELPNRNNRLLVFSKMLSIPLGEKYFYTTMNSMIFRPTFTGNNIRNKENMYLYWFDDEEHILEESFHGNNFWMTVKFFNSDNGSIYDFTNKIKSNNNINEADDLYYKMVIEDDNYQIFDMSNTRVGKDINPIKFYQKKW